MEESKEHKNNKIEIIKNITVTVGWYRYTYTFQLRFEAKNKKNSMDWNLVMKDAKLSDSGMA